jgi:RNA recognition motif-containing protein
MKALFICAAATTCHWSASFTKCLKKHAAFAAGYQGERRMNIFVGNLPASVTSADLRRLFDGYGTIINAIVMRDTATGLPLGYGHVYLVPDDAAFEALINLQYTLLKDSPIVVRECVYRTAPDRRVGRQPWKGVERRVAGSRRHNGHDRPAAATAPRRAKRGARRKSPRSSGNGQRPLP